MDLKYATLYDHPELVDQTLEIIENSFAYTSNFSFKTDFYPLMSEKNWPNNLIAIERKNNQVIGHLGFLKRSLHINGKNFPIGMIGGIAVSSSFRKSGIAGTLLSRCIELNTSDVGLFLLWSNLSDYYRKWDFTENGKVFVTQAGNNPTSPDQLGFLKISPDERSAYTPQLSLLYNTHINNHFISLVRDEESWDDLLCITSSDLFVHRSLSGQVDGYFFKGKGFDLQDIIHEYVLPKSIPLESFCNLGEIWHASIEGLALLPHKTLFMAMLRPGSQNLFKQLSQQITPGNFPATTDAQIAALFNSSTPWFISGLDSI